MYKRVGFFFEMSDEEQRLELVRLRRQKPSEHETKILNYLKSGVSAGVAMVIERDVLSQPPSTLGEVALKSDGKWVWPESLAYFLAKYHIELPEDFVVTMIDNNWEIPNDAAYIPEIPEGHVEM